MEYVFRIKNYDTNLYLGPRKVWEEKGTFYNTKRAAECRLSYCSKVKIHKRRDKMSRFLNCPVEWENVKVVKTKLVDVDE